MMMDFSYPLSAAARAEWQRILEAADRNNIFCHCRRCQREWVASTVTACVCGSNDIQAIACWQFPDD
ncbi:MAG: hypothetical protein RML75_15455 [Cyanobacteriota bacterium SKYGB_h_bin112]|nr:hypothetical protein [Cyanobacteriota bacterium SKYGB_h_bin112]